MKVENVKLAMNNLDKVDNPQNQTAAINEDINNNVLSVPFDIDLHDPNAPEACFVDQMSRDKKSWIAMLLKPFDMLYYLCGKAGDELYQNYQQQINKTLLDFENTLIDTRQELKKVLGEQESKRLYNLYESSVNIKNDIQAFGTDTIDKKRLLEKIDDQIQLITQSLPLTPLLNKFLHVLQQGCCLRTPLFMLQVAFATPTPEIPGGYSKTGLQFQLVIPTIEIFKKLFLNKTIENIFLQPYIHLEGGISAKLDLNSGLPVNFQACVTGMRVTHFGLNITLSKTDKGWHCIRNDYIIEAVNRLEGHIAVNKEIGNITPGLQAKLGGDTVRQFVFPCNTSGTIKFITQCAARAIGAVAAGALALGNGLSFESAKGIGIVGQDLTGICIDISGLVKPDKVVDIVELLTLGIDLAVATDVSLPGVGNLDLMLMNRLNGSYLVEHDKIQSQLASSRSKSGLSNEQHIRKRKISPEIINAQKIEL